MIIRPLDSSEKQAYNAAVKHPLQSWDWGEFRKKTHVDVERYGIFQDSKMMGGMQITFHPIPHFSYTIGYFPKGPMPDEEQLHALVELGKKKNALFIKIEPQVGAPVGSTSAHETIRQFLFEHNIVSGKPLFTKYTFLLDLTPSEEKLLEHMKPKTRYNIHLAEKKGVEIFEDSTDAGLEAYLNILKETTTRQQFYAHDDEYFRTMWQTLKDSGMVHIFRAMYQEKTLVVWIMFIHNNVLYYPYGASSSEYRDVMASNLMMWRMIQYGKQQGCTQFDMWGSLGPDANPKDPWYGFHKFKEGYGGVLTEFLGSYDVIVNPRLYNIFQMLDKWRWKYLRLKASLFPGQTR